MRPRDRSPKSRVRRWVLGNLGPSRTVRLAELNLRCRHAEPGKRLALVSPGAWDCVQFHFVLNLVAPGSGGSCVIQHSSRSCSRPEMIRAFGTFLPWDISLQRLISPIRLAQGLPWEQQFLRGSSIARHRVVSGTFAETNDLPGEFLLML